MLTRTRLLVLAIIILAGTSGWLGYVVLATPAPSIGATVEPGSLFRDCTYTFYVDGSSVLATKGDGSGNKYSGTNHRVVIQNAFDDGGAGKYCFSKGTYNIEALASSYSSQYPKYGLVISSNMKIVGEGRASILKASAMPNAVLVNKQLANNLLVPDYGITVSDIAIQGFAPSGGTFTASDIGIHLTDVQNVTINHVYIRDFNNGAVVIAGSETAQAVFANKPIANNIYIQNSESVNSQSGFQVSNGAIQIRMLNNFLYKNYDVGLGVNAANWYIEDTIISGNWVDNDPANTISYGGIEVVGNSDAAGNLRVVKVDVTNNYLSNVFVAQAIQIIDANQVVVSGNHLNKIRAEGIVLAATKGDQYNFLFSANFMIEPGMALGGTATQAGIVIYAASTRTIGQFTIQENRISGSSALRGIYEYKTAAAAYSGTISNANYIGNSVWLATVGITALNEFNITQSAPYLRGNIGRLYKETNGGTATISASTSVIVTHGLVTTPTHVLVTPQASATFWVSAVGLTTFTINISVSGTVTFYWSADVY